MSVTLEVFGGPQDGSTVELARPALGSSWSLPMDTSPVRIDSGHDIARGGPELVAVYFLSLGKLGVGLYFEGFR